MPPSLAESEPDRVALIKPSALGDIVQTLPILSALRARWPRARIVWVVNRSFAGILEGHPELDGLILFDRKLPSWGRRLSALAGLVRTLRGERFDLALDLQGLLRSGLLAFVSGAPRRVGSADAREGSRLLYTDLVPALPWETPAIERYRQFVRACGGPDLLPPARFGLRPEHRAFAEQVRRDLPSPCLVVHPGAQWVTKRWPPGKFAAVLRRVRERAEAGIVLVGGPGERSLCGEVAAGLGGPCVDLCGETSLLQLAAVLESADVLLSNDSGPMHLAAALGTRCVSLFTCTSPVRAGPHGPHHRVLPTRVSCAASYRKTCPLMTCMDDLTVDRVSAALTESLAARVAG